MRALDKRAALVALGGAATFAFAVVLGVTLSHGHAHDRHGDEHEEAATRSFDEEVAGGREPAFLPAIVADYERTIEPLFREKCFDCHSQRTRFPWFYSLPLIHARIDGYVESGRLAVHMTDGFPFASGRTTLAQLRQIRARIHSAMPPRQYTAVFPSRALSTRDRELIGAWLDQSERRLLGAQAHK